VFGRRKHKEEGRDRHTERENKQMKKVRNKAETRKISRYTYIVKVSTVDVGNEGELLVTDPVIERHLIEGTFKDIIVSTFGNMHYKGRVSVDGDAILSMQTFVIGLTEAQKPLVLASSPFKYVLT